MRRMVGPTGLLDGHEIRRALDAMEGPGDTNRSNALFEQVMVKLVARERRYRRLRQFVQVARAAVAAVMGAGALRLLTH